MRIIAKISPKMAKKQSFFIFFDFLKNCSYDSNESFYSHSTPNYGPLCAISRNSYDWNVRNIAKVSPKMVKKQSFFSFSQKLFLRFERKVLHHYTPNYGLLCAFSINSYDWNVRHIAKIIPKMAKSSPKTVIFLFF